MSALERAPHGRPAFATQACDSMLCDAIGFSEESENHLEFTLGIRLHRSVGGVAERPGNGIEVRGDSGLDRRDNHLATILSKVTVELASGGTAAGDVLIGADGVRSTVRSYLLPEGPHPAYTGIVGLGGFTPLASLPPIVSGDREALTYTCGPRGFFGYGGADAGTMMWWSNLWRKREFSHEELANLSQTTIQAWLLERYRGYHEPISSLIEHTRAIVRINVYDILSRPAWHRGRVALMGEAAHAVSPNAGQGASMALEDAMALAMVLRDCCGDYARAFARFERMRKPRTEKVVAMGRKRGGDKEEVSAFQSRLRNTMLKLFLGMANAKSDRWLFGYKLDWNQTAL